MKFALATAIGLGLLAALFAWMKPPPETAPAAAAAAAPSVAASPVAPAAAAPAEPTSQAVELVVQNKRLVSGPQVVTVTEGTAVTLRIRSDEPDELHLHGYDLTLKLPRDTVADLSFVADRSGRFEYELHNSHLLLGVLEVLPR